VTPSPITRTRCCVVGGGPAGMVTAALLARAGIETLVLEKHGDFRRDFRGDSVHPSTMDLLGELGWLGDFLQRPHQELGRIRAHIGTEEVTLADFSHLSTRARFIALMPQRDFLTFLLDHARVFPTFSIRMNTKVVEPIEHEGRVAGVRAETDGGSINVIADLVIAADGRRSVLREASGFHPRSVGSPIDVLWFRLPRREGDPTESLGWVQQGHLMVMLDRGAYWQIAFVIPKGGFDALKAAGIDAFRRDIVNTAPFFGDRVHALRFEDVKLLVVTIDRLKRWWREGLLFLGDAAHAMSPVGGIGINLAIQDAVAAANILSGPLSRGEPVDGLLARVQERRELPTRVTQTVQATIQGLFLRGVLKSGHPARPGTALRLIDRLPTFLQGVPARLLGLGFRPEHLSALLA